MNSNDYPVELVKVYENQKYVFGLVDLALSTGEFIPHPQLPYCNSSLEVSESPDCYTLPPNWKWIGNWKLEIDRSCVDKSGLPSHSSPTHSPHTRNTLFHCLNRIQAGNMQRLLKGLVHQVVGQRLKRNGIAMHADGCGSEK